MPSISPPLLRLCRLIRYGSVLFVAGVLLLYFFTWCLPEMAPFHVRLAGLPANALAQLDWPGRMLMGGVSLPYLAALLWAFYRLHKMLAGFERGEFFERATVGHMRAFSGYLLLAKLLSLTAMHARMHLAAHMQLIPGHVGVINLSNDDMAVILMCGLFFLIAHTLEEARRIAEENREFI